MISFLRGVVAEKSGKGVVLDVGGVGYGVLVSDQTFADLSYGKEAHLVVYEHIKEDTHDLYGFLDQPSKQLFEKLLGVNGVGPKMALSIMNIGNASQLVHAITTGDTSYIQGASGVGKRLAERLVVDLKDKLGQTGSEDALHFLQDSPNRLTDEAVQALVALGFAQKDAQLALRDIDESLPLEQRIKQALARGAS